MFEIKPVRYWDKVVFPSSLEKYRTTIQQLLDFDLRSVNFKQIERYNNYNIFRVKTDKKGRLIITVVNGALIILEDLPEHDYENSAVLNAIKANQFEFLINKRVQDTREEWVSIDIGEVFGEEHVSVSSEEIRFQKTQLYGKEFVTLSFEQEEIVRGNLPMILIGNAGTGKTLVGIHLLEDLALRATAQAESSTADSHKRYLYLTNTPLLAEQAEMLLATRPLSAEAYSLIECRSIKDLFQSIYPQLKEKTLTGVSDFEAWYLKVPRKAQNKKKQDLTQIFGNAKKVYQELKICSCLTLEEYKSLAPGQSIFHEGEERAFIFDILSQYRAFQAHHNQFDPYLFAEESPEMMFDGVVYDEAQYGSRALIRFLLSLVTKGEILFALDPRQDCLGYISNLNLVKGILRDVYGVPPIVELKKGYRCKKNILRLAEGVNRLETIVVGGHAHKLSGSSTEAAEGIGDGQAKWLDALSEKDTDYFQTLATSIHFAIITRSEHVEKLKALFGTQLVFTPQQAAGLQFLHVLAYDLMDPTLLKEANLRCPLLHDPEQGGAAAGHAPSAANQVYLKFAETFHELNVAVTRGIDTVTVFQPPHRHLQHLCDFLRSYTSSDALLETEVTRSSEKEWLEYASRLTSSENSQDPLGLVAEAIRAQYRPKDEVASVAAAAHTKKKKTKKVKAEGMRSTFSTVADLERYLAIPTQLSKALMDRHVLLQCLASEESCIALSTALKKHWSKRGLPNKFLVNMVKDWCDWADKDVMRAPFNLASETSFGRMFLLALIQLDPKLLHSVNIQYFNICELLKCHTGVKIFEMIVQRSSKVVWSVNRKSNQENDGFAFLEYLHQPQWVDLLHKFVPLSVWKDLFSDPKIPFLVLKHSQDLFLKLTKKNPELITAHSFHHRDARNHTLLTTLIVGEGQDLLYKLFSRTPQLMVQIPKEIWTLRLNALAEEDEGASPIFILTVCPCAKKILLLMLNNPSPAMHDILREVWRAPIPTYSSEISGGPFFRICESREPRVRTVDDLILKTLLLSPELMADVPIDAWSEECRIGKYGRNVSTALFWLVTHSADQADFKLLAERHPDTIRNIPIPHWEHVFINPYTQVHTSVVKILLQFRAELFICFLEKYPDVVAKFSPKVWAVPFRKDEPSSPIEFLVGGLEGQAVLKLILKKYPQLISGTLSEGVPAMITYICQQRTPGSIKIADLFYAKREEFNLNITHTSMLHTYLNKIPQRLLRFFKPGEPQPENKELISQLARMTGLS